MTDDGIDERGFGYVMGGALSVWRGCRRCAGLVNPGGEDLHLAWHERIEGVTR